jgi:multidrug resistance efflux pump
MDLDLMSCPVQAAAHETPPLADEAAATHRDLVDEIILHSEPVVHILGVPPHWLVRWGTTAMVAVVALLATLAWLIHYPDVVSAAVAITTPVPPAIVVAQASGHLIDLTIHEGDNVERGDVLARIRNTADPGAVAKLAGMVAQWEKDPEASQATDVHLAMLPLGELQGDYAAVARAQEAYSYNLKVDAIGAQMRIFAAQREPLQERFESLQRQRVLLVDETAIAQQDLNRVTELARRQDASLLTLDDRARVVLATEERLEGVVVDLANTRLELDRIEHTVTELRARDRQQREDLRMALLESIKTLSGKLALWERAYVLRAPISGRVSLSRYWTDSQFVRAGDDVMAIVPSGRQTPIGKLSVPINRAGSVQLGQTVFIRLDNYPAEQFGLLKGIITTISPVPQSARYAAEITLPAGMVTTFGRRLVYQQEMQGQAEIMIENLRVIDRIFYQFRRLLQNGTIVAPPQKAVAETSGGGTQP